MFDVKKRDGLARIGRLEINNKKIETPVIAVVINPNKMLVDMDFIHKELGAELIITNAYILRKSKYREEIEDKGLHRFFGFDGVIYTDSGTFQMYSKGKAEISNEETISFQIGIGSDLITPLDVFTLPTDSKKTASIKLKETIKRIEYLKSLAEKENLNYVFPIQGGKFIDLREYMAQEGNKFNASLYAIGGIVPLMESYQYYELMRIVFAIKRVLNPSFPVHAFGAGHPMIFPLLVYAGVDIFDSASYSLYAEDWRYITETRTYNLKDMEYLPCSCMVCSSLTPKEMTKEELAKHNLIKIFEEISRIKEYIRRGEFDTYVEQRIGSHPELIKAYRLIRNPAVRSFIYANVSSTKTSTVFWVREETKYRVIFDLVRYKLSFVNSEFEDFRWYASIRVPVSLALTYPFGQFQYLISYEKYKERLKEIMMEGDRDNLINIIKDILAYQLESSKIYSFDFTSYGVIVSKTGRIKHLVYQTNNKVAATLRASDNIFIPSREFAKELYAKSVLNKYVVISDEAKEFVRAGKNVFNKFVLSTSPNIHPGDVVAIVDKDQEFINVGISQMTTQELLSFKRGVGVNVR